MTITDRTRKLLWGNSGGRCAACYRSLVADETELDDPSVVGDECHIISGQANGPRYDPAYPPNLIDAYDNLIILCRVDHKRVDDQKHTFDVDALRRMKAKHERRVAWALNHADELPYDDGDPAACVARYVAAFSEFHQSDLAGLAATPVTVDGESSTSARIPDEPPLGRTVLTGISGSGKTHLMRHVALRVGDTGGVPIFARASAFDGDIERLLDRAVAPFDNASFAMLRSVCTAAGAALSLFIDAVNECSPALRDRLREAVTSYARGPFASVWVSSTTDPHLPAFEHCIVFAALKPEDRQRVFAAHAPHVTVDSAALATFETPFALAIAAETVRDATHALSAFELLDRFTEARLTIAEHPIRARALLQGVAQEMGRTFRASVSGRRLRRLAEEMASRDAIGDLDALLRSGLLRADGSDLSFMHEQVQLFYEANALMDGAIDLSSAIAAPDARRLAPFVLAGLEDIAILRDCATRLADPTLLAAMLRGSFGDRARSVTATDADALFEGSRRAVHACIPHIEHDTERYAARPAIVVFEGLAPLTLYEAALCAAIGAGARHGIFLEQIVALLRTTEAKVYAITHTRDRAWVFADLFVLRPSTSCAAAAIVRAASDGWFTTTPDVLRLIQLIEPLSQAPDSALYLACELLRHSDVTCTEALRIFREAWSRHVYHLSLAALMLLESRRSIATDGEVAAVRAIIEKCLGNNIILNTAVADVMVAYDAFESPVSDPAAAQEFAELLAAPENTETYTRAYSLVGNIFEDIYQGAYSAAFENLSPDDRISMLIRAALGADPGGFHLDWILYELAQRPEARMLPAFVRWATVDPAGSSFPQGAVLAFFLGVGACAALGEPFAAFEERSPAHHVWRTLAQIVYATNGGKPRAPIPALWCELVGSCDAVLEALECLDRAIRFPERRVPILLDLFTVYPSELKKLLETSVTRDFATVSIHPHGSPGFDRTRAACFVLGKLTALGDEHTVSLLEPYVGDPSIGVEVVNTIRAIRRK
jgi:hypothetical protein